MKESTRTPSPLSAPYRAGIKDLTARLEGSSRLYADLTSSPGTVKRVATLYGGTLPRVATSALVPSRVVTRDDGAVFAAFTAALDALDEDRERIDDLAAGAVRRKAAGATSWRAVGTATSCARRRDLPSRLGGDSGASHRGSRS